MSSLKRVGEKFLGFISKLIEKRKVRRSFAAVLFFVLLTLIISVDYGINEVNLEVGEVSNRDVFAPQSVVFRDEVKTREARQEARNSIEEQYEKAPEITQDVEEDISSLFTSIKTIKSDSYLNKEEKIQKISEQINFSFSEENIREIVSGSENNLNQLENGVNSLVAQALEEGITFENLDRVTERIVAQVNNMGLGTPYTNLAEGIVHQYLRPNYFYDKEKTEFLQSAAMDAVPPVMVTVKENEKIIEEGEVVTEEDIAKLQALGLTDHSLPVKSIIGTALMVALMMIVVLLYLYQQNREIYKSSGYVYLLGLIVVGILGIGKAIMAIDSGQWSQLGALFAYMVPIAAAGMLIAILLDSRLAVLIVSIMSFMLGVMTEGQIRFAIVGLIGGISGVYSVSKLSQRGDLARAGVYTSAANVIAIFTMGMVSDTPMGLVITSSIGMGIINGLLSSILTNGALPYLESAFSITSSFRLLEISHPSMPLLRRLLTEAPGTYHHSILVGNMVESAANEVDGEPLLARVGAYYHDIGKLKRPLFFIENQSGLENPHDKIAPSLSTLIITTHVKDGVELAKEAKLPQNVIDIIEQHHGTTLCSYFYQKAKEKQQDDSITENDFRYDGPKPQTKEAALVMLADSVEAAVRSMQDRTPGKVEGTVRKIIRDKLMDGQLDESDLTLRDLDTIADSFLRVLSGILHTRIEYPDAEDIERRKLKNDSTRRKFTRKNGGRR